MLGVKKRQNKKVTLSQLLEVSPSPKDTLHHETRARACQEHSEVGEKLPVHQQQVKEAPRIRARASHGYWEQEKFVTFFQLLTPLSFLGSPGASVCVCNAWKSSFMANRTMAQSTGTKTSTRSKEVSQLKVQEAYKDRQEELEKSALPEAQRIGVQYKIQGNSQRSMAKESVNVI